MVSFICPLLCRIILPMDLKLEWVAAVLGIHESLLWLPHLGPPTVKAGILLCYFFISSHPDSLHKFPWQSFTRIAPPSNPSAMQENLSSSLTWLCQQMHMTLPFVYYVFMPKRKLSWSFHLNTLIMLLFFQMTHPPHPHHGVKGHLTEVTEFFLSHTPPTANRPQKAPNTI